MSASTSGLTVLARPRILHLLTLALVTRIAIAVLPITLLVSLAQPYGYGIAAFVNGTYILLLAFVAPLRGRVLDRFGQRRALLPMAICAVTFTILVAVSVTRHWSWVVSLLLVIAAGLTSPPLNAALRTSWRTVVNGEEGPLKVVHSADSVLEELGFVLAPLFAGLTLTLLAPHRAYQLSVLVYVAAILNYLIAIRRYNLGQRQVSDAAEISVRRASLRRWVGPLAEPRMLLIIAPLLVMGSVFGGVAIFVPAVTQHLDARPWMGPLLAMISIGGVVGGVLYGAVPWKADLWRKYRILTLGFAVPACFFVIAQPLWLLAIVLVCTGLFVTPVFINAFLLVDRDIRADTRHEANTWVAASTDVANGIVAMVIGALVAADQWTVALGVLSGCAAVGVTVALFNRGVPVGNRRGQPGSVGDLAAAVQK
jgi:MFS family permease